MGSRCSCRVQRQRVPEVPQVEEGKEEQDLESWIQTWGAGPGAEGRGAGLAGLGRGLAPL